MMLILKPYALRAKKSGLDSESGKVNMWIKWISGVDNRNLSTKWEKVGNCDGRFFSIAYICFTSKLTEVYLIFYELSIW